MLRQIVAGVALMSSAMASAADWTLVAQCGDPGQERLYSYDPSSISRDPSIVAVKMRGDYSRLVQKGARESEMTWLFDCAQRTWVESSRKVYDSEHRAVVTFDNPTAAMKIVPSSVADKVSAVVCS